MGVDMMDCVLPTRAGRHGLLFRRALPGESLPASPAPIAAESNDTPPTEATPETQSGAIVRMNIKRLEYAEDPSPIDPTCACLVCRRYTRAYLRHLFVAREPLGATLNSIHNLAFYLDTMQRIREDLMSANSPKQTMATDITR
jgi:queuine tRNA-ribosyltransferase